MPVSFQRLTKAGLMAAGLAASIGIAVSAIGKGDWFKSASHRPASNFVNGQVKDKRPPLALITIRPQGFEPAEITRPKGNLFIVVENRSGLDSVTLRLDREAGARLKEVQVPLSKLDWYEGFDLTPGRYVLTEAAHPDWVCRINVTAQ